MKLKTVRFFILLAIFLPFYFFRLKQKLDLPFKTGDRIKIRGLLMQQPYISKGKQIFKIKGILVKAPAIPRLNYGDQIEVIGVVEEKESKSFLNQYQLVNPQVSPRPNLVNTKFNLLKNIFQFRQKLESIINSTLPEPHASLLAGIVLGSQRTLANDFYKALKTTGTLHIIVASGTNITLTAGILLDFLSKILKRKPAIFVSLVCILIYCVMAGMGSPIVRAGLMAGALYLAYFIGREAIGLWLLIFTAAIMLLINPLYLFDVGFQLSFAATSGLIIIGPIFKKVFIKIPFIKSFSEELAQTLSAIIFTFPVLVIAFGHFNPFSVIPNLIVLPIVECLMLVGLLLNFFGLIMLPLAQITAWLIWLPLTFMIQTINFFGQFKIFDLNFPGLSWIFGIGYYLILFSILTNKKRHSDPGS